MCLIFSLVTRKPAIVHLTKGIDQFLPCSPDTNLPIKWRISDSTLLPGPRHTVLSQGLIIKPSFSDAGLYTCETMETVDGRVHRKTVVQYLIQVDDTITVVRNLKAAVITLAVLMGLLILLMCSPLVIRHAKAQKQNLIGPKVAEEEEVEGENDNCCTVIEID